MRLASKRRARTLIVNFIVNLFDDSIEPAYEAEKSTKFGLTELLSFKDVLERKYKKFEQLSEEIGELIEKDDEYTKDVEYVHELLFSKKLTVLSLFMKENSAETPKQQGVTRETARVRLPRFEIKGSYR